MTQIADNPVDQAEEIIELQEEEAEVTDGHKMYSGQSTMMQTDGLLEGRTPIA